MSSGEHPTRKEVATMTKTIELKGRHYNSATGGHTRWSYKNGIITLKDGEYSYRILHFVTGMDGNEHRVFLDYSNA